MNVAIMLVNLIVVSFSLFLDVSVLFARNRHRICVWLWCLSI